MEEPVDWLPQDAEPSAPQKAIPQCSPPEATGGLETSAAKLKHQLFLILSHV